MKREPKFSICEFTTPFTSFEEDLRLTADNVAGEFGSASRSSAPVRTRQRPIPREWIVRECLYPR